MDSFHLLPTQRERRGEQYMPTKQAQPESPNHAFHLLQGFAIVLRKPAPGRQTRNHSHISRLSCEEREGVRLAHAALEETAVSGAGL